MLQTLLSILLGGAIAYLTMWLLMKFKNWEIIEKEERKQLANDVFLLNDKVVTTEKENEELKCYITDLNKKITYLEGSREMPVLVADIGDVENENGPANDVIDWAASDPMQALQPLNHNRVARFLSLHFAKIQKNTAQSSLLSKYTKADIVTNYNNLIYHAIRNIRNGLV